MSLMSDRMKALREDADITQSCLAEIFSLSRSNITKYEAGTIVPTISVLIKYADYFNTSIDYIAGRTDIAQSIDDISIKTKEKETVHFNDDEIALIEQAIKIIKNKKQ